VERDQAFGRPVNFAMEAGDVLVFNGEHLHSSEINSTAITRHVVSYRNTLATPAFIGNSPYKYNYGILLGSSGVVAAGAERGHLLLRKVMRAVNASLGRINSTRCVVSHTEVNGFDDMSARAEPVADLGELLHEDGVTAASVAARLHLQPGSVRAVSEGLCGAQSATGDVVVFPWSCPHQGGDLGLGYVEGSTLHCPWHNLPIDLETGRTPCRSLRAVDIVKRWPAQPGAGPAGP
jgi:nitrite reductase/ring-hydroxylating ferredoxin subunit